MENSFFDELKDIGFFAKLCIIGAIMMLIHSLIAIMTNYGLALLIASIVVILLCTQLEDENDYSVLFGLSIEIVFFFLMLLVPIPWMSDIGSWIGYIGYRLVGIVVGVYIFLIVLDIVLLGGEIPFNRELLIIIGIALFGIHLIFSLVPGSPLYSANIIQAVIYLCAFVVGLILIKMKQSLIGTLIMWFGSIANTYTINPLNLGFNSFTSLTSIGIFIVIGLCVFSKNYVFLGIVVALNVLLIVLGFLTVPLNSGIIGFDAGQTILTNATILLVIDEVLAE